MKIFLNFVNIIFDKLYKSKLFKKNSSYDIIIRWKLTIKAVETD